MLNSLILAADGTNTSDSNNGWIMYVVIGVVLVLMIVMTIVPQKKRQKEQQNMMNSLCVGTKIMTVGGIVGKITQVNADNTLIVNVGTESNPTLIVIDKKAVGYVLEKVNAPQQETAAEEPKAEETQTEETTTENTAEETATENTCDNNCEACAEKADCDKAVDGEVVENK